ncbi:hypothetical protein SAMN05443999_107187 [Roseovarius azorensis]|uniref:Uncharacterized protein n=1 Tax=Roseovarius azorensis TaxID=1287727 RepID=A0A1H7SNS7_9RHOB|nr:hypothetical protein [Roseovarius azorensis]SEL74029.1 hypothetical protein SAMN05443999_107187 [Roseovarius azorensis]
MRSDIVHGALAALALTVTANMATAHEFTAGLLVAGEEREARLAEAVNGFLLAADERDGHADETSDGHLGGVDVQLLPLPAEAAGQVAGLVGTPRMPPDVLVVIGPEPEGSAATASLAFAGVVLRPGALPNGWATEDDTDNFAARYRSAYGSAPTEAAARGYNAARRLDAAIRPLDGISPRVALETALADTASGIDWQENTR